MPGQDFGWIAAGSCSLARPPLRAFVNIPTGLAALSGILLARPYRGLLGEARKRIFALTISFTK